MINLNDDYESAKFKLATSLDNNSDVALTNMEAVVGGSLTNVGAQSIANIYREYNGKESLELNKSNAVAAGLISGGAKKLEGLGIKSWQPVVIGSSASINAVTSGNNPYKDVNKRIESDKSQKDKTK